VRRGNHCEPEVRAGKVLVVRSEGNKKAEQELEVKANALTELTHDAK